MTRSQEELLQAIKNAPVEDKLGAVEEYLQEIHHLESYERKFHFDAIAKAARIPKKTVQEIDDNIDKFFLPKEKKEKKEVDKRFWSEELLVDIFEELDKDHKLDYKEKMALFIVRATAELKNPGQRCSAALKGDSSSGKDNASKTVLKHFPAEDSFFLTRGTQSALEEEAKKVKCIAFSEINKHREGGANADLTEFFKQLSEGGVKVIRRDQLTHEVITIETDQKTLFYGTTETQSDEELETRYIIIPIKGYAEKNKTVINAELDKELDFTGKEDGESWLAQSIRELDHDLEIRIPYAPLFKEKIKDEDEEEKFLFDYTKERIKRDAKRLLSLTKAVAWLHQKQRIIEKTPEGKKILWAEPDDFLVTLYFFADFFNLTYTGLDHRNQKCLETIRELEGKHDAQIMELGFPSNYYGWVLRHKLQETLGIESVNTIKDRIKALKDFQLVETYYDPGNNRAYLVRGCQEGVKRVSLPVSLTAIDTLLTGWVTGSKFYEQREKTLLKPIFTNYLKIIDDFEKNSRDLPEKLTPSKLTCQKSAGVSL